MAIDLVKVRAKIKVGGITVETPFIQSFTVNKARNQVSTFNASLKVEAGQLSGGATGGDVEIWAGAGSASNKIFTGILKHANISPCWDDPGYVLLSISGVDVLSRLVGKKYTRRCRAIKGTWVAITGLARPGLRDGKFSYETDSISISGDQIIPTNKEHTTNALFADAANPTATSWTASINSTVTTNVEKTEEVNEDSGDPGTLV